MYEYIIRDLTDEAKNSNREVDLTLLQEEFSEAFLSLQTRPGNISKQVKNVLLNFGTIEPVRKNVTLGQNNTIFFQTMMLHKA